MPDTWTNEEFRQILTGEHPGLAKFRNQPQAHPVVAALQALQRPVRRAGWCGHEAPRLRPVPRQPGHLPELHQPVPQDRRQRGGDPGHAPVRRHPRVHGYRRAAQPDRLPRLPGALLPPRPAAILDHGGIVDKLVGDEIIGLFFGEILDLELMTGHISNPGTPNLLSAITIGSFRDLGYVVNDAVADSFTFLTALQGTPSLLGAAQLREGVLPYPIIVIDRRGRHVATVPRNFK